MEVEAEEATEDTASEGVGDSGPVLAPATEPAEIYGAFESREEEDDWVFGLGEEPSGQRLRERCAELCGALRELKRVSRA